MKVLAMVACVGVIGAAGCRAERQAEQPAAAARTSPREREMSSAWQSAAVPSNAQSLPVKEGAAPLVYRVDGGATIRVRELGATERDLSRGHVPAGSLVRVDARRGVIYGQDTVFAGPLPDGVRYVIFVEPSGENVARQGTFQPRPRDAR